MTPRADPALLRSALAAAMHGWHVFPCAAGGKRPALRGNWQDLATTSRDQIRDWWARAPYNIGIACGPSGLVVIDLDLPHDGEEDDEEEAADGALFPLSGADILSRLARQRGERYPGGTYVVDTPSGGCHLYFSAAGDARVRNSAGAVGPHIDVRADGGYVVGAGSRIGGRAYTARGRRAPAPLPPWLGRAGQGRLRAAPAVPAPRVPAGDRAQGRAYAMAALRAETAAGRRGAARDAERHAEPRRLQPRATGDRRAAPADPGDHLAHRRRPVRRAARGGGRQDGPVGDGKRGRASRAPGRPHAGAWRAGESAAVVRDQRLLIVG